MITTFVLVIIPILTFLVSNPLNYPAGFVAASSDIQFTTPAGVNSTSGSVAPSTVDFSLSYAVSGGGNASAPWFEYAKNGSYQNVTLSLTPQLYQIDNGSIWIVDQVIPSVLPGERWGLAVGNSTSGVA